MNVSRLVGYTVSVCTAIALCAGCSSGGAQSPLGWSPQPNAARRAWMAPDAKKKDLLYISDEAGSVYVLSYPGGKLEGTLTGFADPQGECVDKKGNVWITLFAAQEILEYAHGGTTSIATLDDPGYLLEGCAIDPTTGNLAAANFAGNNSTSGGVSIYADAQGTPATYTDPDMYLVFSLGYDDKGNLFLDGETQEGGSFAFAELPKGSSKFTNITLNETIKTPGTVQWDGKYITVGDATGGVTYQVAVSGSSATVVGSTTLTDSDGVFQSFIDHKRIIGPNADGSNVMFWAYPAGGNPTKILTGFTDPFGAVVSKGKK